MLRGDDSSDENAKFTKQHCLTLMRAVLHGGLLVEELLDFVMVKMRRFVNKYRNDT